MNQKASLMKPHPSQIFTFTALILCIYIVVALLD